MDNVSERVANPSFQRSTGRTTASTALWGHLLRKTGSSQVPPSSATSTVTLGKHTPTIAPIDKAGASTRILLHDTQAHLEKFTDRVTQLTTGVDSAKRELAAVQKLYEDDHEQIMDRISGLANRCQTELQKTIGRPAQSADVRDVAKDLSHLASKIEALDNKLDTLNSLNQTQSQALQAIQQQQGQLLTALMPILPLLQTLPLHIENARDRVKDSILEMRQDALRHDAAPKAFYAHGHSQVSRRSRARSSGPSTSCDPASPPGRKKRRLDAILDDSTTPAGLASTQQSSVEANRTPPIDSPSVDSNPAPAASQDISLATLLPRPTTTTPFQTPPGRMLRSRVKVTPVPAPSHALPARASRSVYAGPLRSFRVSSNVAVPRTPVHVSHRPSDSTTPVFATSPGSSSRSPAHHHSSLTHPGGETLATVSPRVRLAGCPDSSASLMHDLALGTASRDIKHESLVRLARLSGTPQIPGSPASGRGVSEGTMPLGTPSVVGRGEDPACNMPPPSSVGRPLSLKDRRALFPEAQLPRDEGKRFIPLDDDEDEDFDCIP